MMDSIPANEATIKIQPRIAQIARIELRLAFVRVFAPCLHTRRKLTASMSLPHDVPFCPGRHGEYTGDGAAYVFTRCH